MRLVERTLINDIKCDLLSSLRKTKINLQPAALNSQAYEVEANIEAALRALAECEAEWMERTGGIVDGIAE